MIPHSTLTELIGKQVRIYIKGLPDPHCMQQGIIENVTEHLLLLNDKQHTDMLYIPIENISFIKRM